MYKIILLLVIGLSMTLLSCHSDELNDKFKPPFIEGEDMDPEDGADSELNEGDNANSDYYINPDFYNMKSNDHRTLISNFKTMQQTTEWSCGCVSTLVVLNHFDIKDETEQSLAYKLKSSIDSTDPSAGPGSAVAINDMGTRLENIYNYFQTRNELNILQSSYKSNYTTEDLIKEGDLFPSCDIGNLYPVFDSYKDFSDWIQSNLKANRPIMVEWSDWDGHWVVIIGIDNNNTETYVDDILILADSYDTADHWQDGYTIAPLEKFMALWKDRVYAPKPYQLQPFIVVDLNNQKVK